MRPDTSLHTNVPMTMASTSESCSAFHDKPVYGWPLLRAAWAKRLRFPELEVDIIRHGETTHNAAGLVSGKTDVELSCRGRMQALELAAHLRPPYRAIFVSTMRRSRDTLEIALAERGIRMSYVSDWRLNERGLGELEGKPRVFIHEFAGGDLDYAPVGGESYRSVTARSMSFLYDLYQQIQVSARGSRLLLCTHMGPMRVLTGILQNEYSASRMLATDWGNAMVSRQRLATVQWPRFLSSANRALPLRKKVD